MRKSHVLLTVFGLGLTVVLLAGCTLRGAPDVEPTPIIGEEQGMETVIAEITPPVSPTVDLLITPTTMPTEPSPLPTVAPTPFPTPVPTVAPTVQPTTAPQPTSPPSDGGTYVVQPGDTLFSIAQRFGTTVEALAARNNIVNPHLIRVGQVLQVDGSAPPSQPPPSQGDIVHVVQPGENLFRIALRYNMSYLFLAAYNNINNPHNIQVGQTILIPQ